MSFRPVPVLVPDLPDAAELLPWLRQIDRARHYTNFGPLLQQFESRVAELLAADAGDGPAARAVSSGTTALELALTALELPQSARVLLPSLTFPATALAVQRCGLIPVLADCDAASWMLTPALAAAAHARAPVAAVLPVAAYGRPVPAAAWAAFHRQHGVPVVVDAAAALGNQAVADGLHAVFSLHATKPFGIGEGGLVVSCDRAFLERVHRLQNFGFDAGLVQRAGGGNGKLSEYHAAIGLAQLARWPSLRERRLELLARYRQRFAARGDSLGLQAGASANPAYLIVRLPHAAQPVREPLARLGIETRRWYCPPLHDHPAFDGLERLGPEGRRQLPVTEALAETLLGLPFHTHLTVPDIDHVCDGLHEVLALAGPETTR